MESEFITKLQNQLKQAGLSRVEKPKTAKGINADKRNQDRQYNYNVQVTDAKDDRFNKRLQILSGAIPETPEQYVELFQFMESYHGQLTNGFDKVEKIPSAVDAIDDNYFLRIAPGSRHGIVMRDIDHRNIHKDPSSIYEEYISRFPVYLMKDRHYKNAAMRFPDDATIADLCATHEEEIKELKDNIIARFNSVKEENISRIEILKKQIEEKDAEEAARDAEKRQKNKEKKKKYIKIAGIIIAIILILSIIF